MEGSSIPVDCDDVSKDMKLSDIFGFMLLGVCAVVFTYAGVRYTFFPERVHQEMLEKMERPSRADRIPILRLFWYDAPTVIWSPFWIRIAGILSLILGIPLSFLVIIVVIGGVIGWICCH